MTRYSTFLSAGLTVLLALFLCACQMDKADPKLILPPDHVLLEARQTAQTPDGLTVKADSVSVSICPGGAYCLIANNASTKLTLSKNTQTSTVRLFAFISNYVRRIYPNMPLDSTSVTLDGKQYKVILRDGRQVVSKENGVINQVIVQVAPL
jgi:hypothetical protein